MITLRLRYDRRRQAEELGAEVEALLGSDPLLHWEAWHKIKGWCRAAVNRAPPPAQVMLKHITAEGVELYRYVPPPGASIPISVDPFPVDELVPTEDEIDWAVKRLRDHRSGGPSGL